MKSDPFSSPKINRSIAVPSKSINIVLNVARLSVIMITLLLLCSCTSAPGHKDAPRDAISLNARADWDQGVVFVSMMNISCDPICIFIRDDAFFLDLRSDGDRVLLNQPAFLQSPVPNDGSAFIINDIKSEFVKLDSNQSHTVKLPLPSSIIWPLTESSIKHKDALRPLVLTPNKVAAGRAASLCVSYRVDGEFFQKNSREPIFDRLQVDCIKANLGPIEIDRCNLIAK